MAGEAGRRSLLTRLAGRPGVELAARPVIRVEAARKSFGAVRAVDDVSLDILPGEAFSLLGASGCGKTTLLRLIAGLERLDEGRIEIDGQDVTDAPPYARPVNMMFQAYALFPHMDVQQNVAFGLKQQGMARGEIRERVAEMLKLVELEELARRRPHQLSGGQQQRVALARALARQPRALLLDEPLAALDRKLRERTQFELMRIQERTGVAFLIVTHDQEEAMALSDRIAVMDGGRVVQTGAPAEIYERPASRFVADFVGSANLFEGRLAEAGAGHAVVESEEAGCPIYVDRGVGGAAGAVCWVALRPEKVELTRDPPADRPLNCARGKIEGVAYLGGASSFEVRLESGKRIRASRPSGGRGRDATIGAGDEVWASWRAASPMVLFG
jgi:putrescine transport system ATP-binding protein